MFFSSASACARFSCAFLRAATLGEGAGRLSELLSTHPYLPKRVQAIRLFAQSHHYRAMIGERGGSPLDEVDTEVERIIKVL